MFHRTNWRASCFIFSYIIASPFNMRMLSSEVEKINQRLHRDLRPSSIFLLLLFRWELFLENFLNFFLLFWSGFPLPLPTFWFIFICHVCLLSIPAKQLQSCPTLCDRMDCILPGSPVHGDSPGKNTQVGSLSLLQGVFLTQGLNPSLLHCRQILYHLNYQGSPITLL